MHGGHSRRVLGRGVLAKGRCLDVEGTNAAGQAELGTRRMVWSPRLVETRHGQWQRAWALWVGGHLYPSSPPPRGEGERSTEQRTTELGLCHPSDTLKLFIYKI